MPPSAAGGSWAGRTTTSRPGLGQRSWIMTEPALGVSKSRQLIPRKCFEKGYGEGPRRRVTRHRP
jgi:hypothetical protein